MMHSIFNCFSGKAAPDSSENRPLLAKKPASSLPQQYASIDIKDQEQATIAGTTAVTPPPLNSNDYLIAQTSEFEDLDEFLRNVNTWADIVTKALKMIDAAKQQKGITQASFDLIVTYQKVAASIYYRLARSSNVVQGVFIIQGFSEKECKFIGYANSATMFFLINLPLIPRFDLLNSKTILMELLEKTEQITMFIKINPEVQAAGSSATATATMRKK